MNILIVDDDEVIQLLVHSFIEQYRKKHNIDIRVRTALDGGQAVEWCNLFSIDMIFMDINMPGMNGVEATSIIKEKHPKTMIIIMSSLGNDETRQKLLHDGATDYISKPLKGHVFESRFQKYLQLAEKQNHISNTPKAYNLFTTKVFNYYMRFSIATENDLVEFWEAILQRLAFQRTVEGLNDLVRFMYQIGSMQVQKKHAFSIIIEEEIDNFFFTIK